MTVIKCPGCRKSLKVSDASEGKRIRCPACKNPFVVPESAVELEEVQKVQEIQTERPTRRPRREPEEDEERPRRSRRARDDDDEEEEERPRRPGKRRPRDDDDDGRDIAPSSAPLILAILSCVFSCAPLIGFILGRLAMNKADQEIARLSGKRYRDARKQLQLARTIGIIGMCLSGFFLVVAVVWNIIDRAR